MLPIADNADCSVKAFGMRSSKAYGVGCYVSGYLYILRQCFLFTDGRNPACITKRRTMAIVSPWSVPRDTYFEQLLGSVYHFPWGNLHTYLGEVRDYA